MTRASMIGEARKRSNTVKIHRTASSGVSAFDADRSKGVDWDKVGLHALHARAENSAAEFLYLRASGCVEVDGVSDLEEMEDLHSSLVNLGLRHNERQNLLALTSAVLLLGQIRFVEKGGFEGGSKVDSDGSRWVLAWLLAWLLACLLASEMLR